MSDVDFITVVEQESERFARAVAPLTVRDRPVPACPDWTVRDLLVHLGEVQRFWAGAVLAGGDRPGEPDQADPGDGDPAGWYDQSRARLVDVLRAADPGAPCWAWWAPGQTVGDVARRQAHEAAVHRWDAESSAATPAPLEPALAADGVDEFFGWILPACRPGCWSPLCWPGRTWTEPAGAAPSRSPVRSRCVMGRCGLGDRHRHVGPGVPTSQCHDALAGGPPMRNTR